MDWLTVPYFVAGLVLLIVGAELLVQGAARLATAAGISPLVVGLTVVAYGTSAPELAVTLQASLADPPQPDLAIGNVVGSNISNIVLVLGTAAVVAALHVSAELLTISLPLMVLSALAVYVLGRDGAISQLEGGLLAVGALAYTCLTVVISRRQTRALAAAAAAVENEGRAAGLEGDRISLFAITLNLIRVAVGLGLLLGGAQLLVRAAVQVAQALGISELVVGLTIVAVGTSLPEIATSVVAGFRGHRDIAVGNVVGSNIFNVLFVLGLTAVASPAGVPVAEAALRIDIPVMIAITIGCVPFMLSGRSISRAEGLLFLGIYAAYTAYLFSSAGGG